MPTWFMRHSRVYCLILAQLWAVLVWAMIFRWDFGGTEDDEDTL